MLSQNYDNGGRSTGADNAGGENADAGVVDFGFTTTQVPEGAHVCQIFDDGDERTDAFVRFLLKGMELHELSAGFSDVIDRSFFTPHISDAAGRDRLQLARTSDAYFWDDRFDPDHMLNLLARFYNRSRERGLSGARVIGEMTPAIRDKQGSERLLEYEARVNLLLRDHPMTVMCQYDAHAFSGSTLMDVLKAHALMVVRGTIVHNPFYVPPETILADS